MKWNQDRGRVCFSYLHYTIHLEDLKEFEVLIFFFGVHPTSPATAVLRGTGRWRGLDGGGVNGSLVG
jgi:hypothetical protein